MTVTKEFRRYNNLIGNFANWYLYPLYKFGLKSSDPLHFETRRGHTVEVPHILIKEFKEIFMTEAYLKGFPNIDPSSVQTVLDIGANAGFFSLFALERFPQTRVYSYEPYPPNFQILERQKSNNSPGRLFAHPNAVSGKSGSLKFYTSGTEAFSTNASFIPDPGRSIAIDVETTTLDDIFKNTELKVVDLLKIDTEGAEYETLFAASDDTLSKIKRICMEVHLLPANKGDVFRMVRFLESKGFQTRYEGTGPLWLLWAWKPPLH